MNSETKRITDNFIAEFRNAQPVCRWSGDKYAVMMASLMIGHEPFTETEAYREAQRIIKINASFFSLLRSGYAKDIVTAAVASSADQQKAVEDITRIHSMLKAGFHDSYKVIIAATMIFMCCEPHEYDETVAKTIRIYNDIKSNHPMIAWGKDIANCALLALSGKDVSFASRDYEDCYREVSNRYRNKSAALYAACALSVFNGGCDIKTDKLVALHNNLKTARLNFTSEGLEIIALMACMFGENPHAVINEIREVSSTLSYVKGLGNWSIGDKIRNMISAAIVIEAYTNNKKLTYLAKQVILNVICSSLEDDDAATVTIVTM